MPNEAVARTRNDPQKALADLGRLGRVNGYLVYYRGMGLEHLLGTLIIRSEVIMCLDEESAISYFRYIYDYLYDEKAAERRGVSVEKIGDETYAWMGKSDDFSWFQIIYLRIGNIIASVSTAGGLPSIEETVALAKITEERILAGGQAIHPSLPDTQFEASPEEAGLSEDAVPGPTDTPTPAIPSTPASPMDARASAFVCGNSSPNLPDGEGNQVAVVSSRMRIGTTGTTVELVLRNNTSVPVGYISVSATAYTPDGKLFATGSDQGFSPRYYVAPGQIAMGYVYFGDARLPDDIRIEYDVSARSDRADKEAGDLEVVDCYVVETRLMGMLKNAASSEVTGPIKVVAYCFDENSNLTGYRSAYTDKDEVKPGESIPFQIPLRGDAGTCPIYLVAGRGFTW
jgi:hypothetical protein